MTHTTKNKKIATLVGLAIVTLASSGSAYYFLNNSSVSADTTNVGLPSIPSLPTEQTATPSTVSTQTAVSTSNGTSLPPVPSAPVNESAAGSLATGLNSSSSDLTALDTSNSSTGIGSYATSTATGSLSTSETLDSSLATTASPEAVISDDTEVAMDYSTLDTTQSSGQTSSGSMLYGIIAGAIAGISLVAFVVILLKGRNNAPSTTPDLPQI